MGTFSGPNVVKDSDYLYHVCISSGTFIPSFSGSVEYLVVAGGGGGGMDMGGGGGGGGVLSGSTSVTAGTSYTVTVGAGGVGAPAGNVGGNGNFHAFTVSATSGANSVFGAVTSTGGGYGGSSYFGYSPNNGYGANGGSGGGSSGYSDGNTGRGGSGTGGQGNAGGGSIGQYYSGGGGGAGAAGQQSPPHGGAGILNNILGIGYYWGAGGGGAAYSTGVGGNGGLGGGGGGASGGTGGVGLNNGQNAGTGGGGDWVGARGGAGGRNTGSGGGGGMHYNRNNQGGNGGSGIVVIRYLRTLGTSTFNGSPSYPLSPIIFNMDAANISKGFAVEALVVAGGGGGGMDMGGGGGGGQAIQATVQVENGIAYPVTVGAGGAGSTGPYAGPPTSGSNGGDSSFGGLYCFGGGGGGSGHYFPYPYLSTNRYGQPGGGQDGGNAGGDSPAWGRNRGSGQSSSYGGYDGGSAGYNGDGSYTAGGGGGAAGHGQGGRGTWRAGDGGIGFVSAINGTSYYWGGGGGGSGWGNTGGNGGAGGGGGGSVAGGNTPGSGDGNGLNAGGGGAAGTNSNGGNAGANTGGGGGGGTHAYSVGGNGGSGVVIIRYYGSQKATGGTITSSGGYTIHTFTSSGTFTPTNNIGASDMSFLNRTVTVNGPILSTAGGGSFQFDGVDDFIDTNFPASVLANSTLEAWVYDTKNNGSYRAILQINVDTDDALYIYPNNQLGFWPFGTSGLTVSANAWHYVAAAYNGSNVLFCVDGQFATINGSSADFTDYDFLRIGAHSSGDGERWGGYIGPCKVYNKALTQDEMFQNFIALRGRFGI